jgi:hypothetical protein
VELAVNNVSKENIYYVTSTTEKKMNPRRTGTTYVRRRFQCSDTHLKEGWRRGRKPCEPPGPREQHSRSLVLLLNLNQRRTTQKSCMSEVWATSALPVRLIFRIRIYSLER